MEQVVNIFLLCPLTVEELRNTWCLLLLHLYVSDKLLLCRSNWSQTRHPSASAFWMPSSEVCATMPSFMVFLLFIYFKVIFASLKFFVTHIYLAGEVGAGVREACAHTTQYTCGYQWATCKRCFSFTMRSGLELRSSSLAANTFIGGSIFPAPVVSL